MGLETFPLLQNHTSLITHNNCVYKLKLEYQNISPQEREVFLQAVSERSAHCQIEDVFRAVLYSIEREMEMSPIQSQHFIIYPEVLTWPLGQKVQFKINGKQIHCCPNLILFRLFCKPPPPDHKNQREPAAVVPVKSKHGQSHESAQDMPVLSPSAVTERRSGRGRVNYHSPTTRAVTTSNRAATTEISNFPNAASFAWEGSKLSAPILCTPKLTTDMVHGSQSPRSRSKICQLLRNHTDKTQSAKNSVHNSHPQSILYSKDQNFHGKEKELQIGVWQKLAAATRTDSAHNCEDGKSGMVNEKMDSPDLHQPNSSSSGGQKRSHKASENDKNDSDRVSSENEENSKKRPRLSALQAKKSIKKITKTVENKSSQEQWNESTSSLSCDDEDVQIAANTTYHTRGRRKLLQSDCARLNHHVSAMDQTAESNTDDQYQKKGRSPWKGQQCHNLEIRTQMNVTQQDEGLQFLDKNVVEISNDGSIVYESEKFDDGADSGTGEKKRQRNKKRHTRSSLAFQKRAKDFLKEQECNEQYAASDDDDGSLSVGKDQPSIGSISPTVPNQGRGHINRQKHRQESSSQTGNRLLSVRRYQLRDCRQSEHSSEIKDRIEKKNEGDVKQMKIMKTDQHEDYRHETCSRQQEKMRKGESSTSSSGSNSAHSPHELPNGPKKRKKMENVSNLNGDSLQTRKHNLRAVIRNDKTSFSYRNRLRHVRILKGQNKVSGRGRCKIKRNSKQSRNSSSDTSQLSSKSQTGQDGVLHAQCTLKDSHDLTLKRKGTVKDTQGVQKSDRYFPDSEQNVGSRQKLVSSHVPIDLSESARSSRSVSLPLQDVSDLSRVQRSRSVDSTLNPKQHRKLARDLVPNSPTARVKLCQAQQRLLTAKDGVWLFGKTSQMPSKEKNMVKSSKSGIGHDKASSDKSSDSKRAASHIQDHTSITPSVRRSPRKQHPVLEGSPRRRSKFWSVVNNFLGK